MLLATSTCVALGQDTALNGAVPPLNRNSPFHPLWVGSEGRPTDAARQVIGELLTVDRHGLVPADYGAAHWQLMAAALDAQLRPSDSEMMDFETGLSIAFVSALRDLHAGRVEPATLGLSLPDRQSDYDAAAAAQAALANGRISDAFAAAEPRLAQYHRIVAVLATYRELAGDTTLHRVPPIRGTVRPGDPLPAAGALRRWLTALGDMRPALSADTDRTYSDDLVTGVRTFQARRGLDSNGTIGPETAAALRVPIAWYVRRLELALERLRWVPARDTGQVIVINIPAFRLWALDSIQSSAPPALAMNAILGQAVGKQTPVLDRTMESVVFRPYWDIPPSIVRREIVPEIRRHPAYLAANDMELLPSTPVPDTIQALASGRVGVRQRPGPENALGLVKFVFPNDRNIYLHGTPAMELFTRTRRDFSHGCIRVENPAALAQYVLRDNPDWTAERIDSAMHGERPVEVKLARAIPVLVFYTTSVAWPDGRVAFYPDIYGHDARLDRALRDHAAKLPAYELVNHTGDAYADMR
jgi:L,D-transpeptidase YcbB